MPHPPADDQAAVDGADAVHNSIVAYSNPSKPGRAASGIRAVAARFTEHALEINVAVPVLTDVERADVEDIVSELAELVPGRPIETVVHEGRQGFTWVGSFYEIHRVAEHNARALTQSIGTFAPHTVATSHPPYDGASMIAWHNYVVAATTQSALGLIGPGIRAVAVTFPGDDVVVHFTVPILTDVERQDIEDIVDRLVMALDARTRIHTILHLGPDRFGFRWDGTVRPIYIAKAPTDTDPAL